MAEEFLHGGVCGGSWWGSPRNLFSSSPCSLASNDIAAGFGWPVMEMKSVRSSDDSASDGSTAAVDHHADGNHWNPDMIGDGGRSEGNYSDFQLDSGMDFRPQISKNFLEDSYGSSLLQTLFDGADSQTMLNYSSSDSNGFLPGLCKPSPMFRQHPPPLWNSTNNVPSNAFLPPPQSQFVPSSIGSIGAKHEEGKELATAAKKVSHEPAFKRPRIETPSPLPTFKVRKEKLGDRITALQQLVSPFGKTDTASVLHEAIEYIKFLHDQVNALSTPYLKHGSPPLQHHQGTNRAKDQQALTKDLKTRGLCLVPISSTFPVASETATDFWNPTFGGSFR